MFRGVERRKKWPREFLGGKLCFVGWSSVNAFPALDESSLKGVRFHGTIARQEREGVGAGGGHNGVASSREYPALVALVSSRCRLSQISTMIGRHSMAESLGLGFQGTSLYALWAPLLTCRASSLCSPSGFASDRASQVHRPAQGVRGSPGDLCTRKSVYSSWCMVRRRCRMMMGGDGWTVIVSRVGAHHEVWDLDESPPSVEQHC